MKTLLPAVLATILITLTMYVLLQFMQWEVAMRIIGISMSVLVVICSVLYLPRSSTIDDTVGY